MIKKTTKKISIRSYRRRTKKGKITVRPHHRRITEITRIRTLNPLYVHMMEDLISRTLYKCTTADIQRALHIHPNTAEKYLNYLERKGKIKRVIIDGRIYWEANYNPL